jgi:hypothetical protein
MVPVSLVKASHAARHHLGIAMPVRQHLLPGIDIGYRFICDSAMQVYPPGRGPGIFMC